MIRSVKALTGLASVIAAICLSGTLTSVAGQASPSHGYTGPQVGQFGEDIDVLGRHGFPLRYVRADQVVRLLKSHPLPAGVTKVETGEDPEYNDVFVTGTWQGVARLHQKLLALDGPARRIRIRLSHIDAPTQTIRRLGFDPYDPGLGANGSTGQAVTARILTAVRQGVLHQTQDVIVTPLDGQSAIVSTVRPAATQQASAPSVSYAPAGSRVHSELLRDGAGMKLIVTPHVLWPNRCMMSMDIGMAGRGEMGANSWTGSGQPILLGTLMTLSPQYKDFRTRTLRSDGILHLVLGIPTIMATPAGKH